MEGQLETARQWLDSLFAACKTTSAVADLHEYCRPGETVRRV